MSRYRWVYVDGTAIPAEQFEPEPQADYHVIGDIEPFQSMCDGSMIMGRRQKIEHYKQHGVVEMGNDVNLNPRANLKNTGVKEAIIRSVQKAKEQKGSRYVEQAMTQALQQAHEMQRHRR